jgi:hypothetical protein
LKGKKMARKKKKKEKKFELTYLTSGDCCYKCGYQIPKEKIFNFCPSCGRRLVLMPRGPKSVLNKDPNPAPPNRPFGNRCPYDGGWLEDGICSICGTDFNNQPPAR